MMKDCLLIIPAYNEERAIGTVLQKIKDAGYTNILDVLVINDASKDQTLNVASSIPGIKIISHVFNLGYGSALQTGYRYALQNGYEYVLQMDSDGQHDVSNIKTLVEALKSTDSDGFTPDIVIGSRFVDGSKSFHVSALKRAAMSFFTALIKIATGKVILDPTSGLQGLNKRAFGYYARFLNFDNKYPDANVIVQMLMLGFRIKEVPSVMHERETGESMHSGVIKPMLYMLIMPLSIFATYMRIQYSKKGIVCGSV